MSASGEGDLENQELRLVVEGLEMMPNVLHALLDFMIELAELVDR